MADTWYAQRGDKQIGPMPQAKLRDALSSGKLRREDLVWCEGWPEWRPAGDVAELSGATGDDGDLDLAPATPTASTGNMGRGVNAALDYRGAGDGRGEVAATGRALDALSATRPWVMLVSILLFIALAFAALFLLLALLAGVGAAFSDGGGAAGAVMLVFAVIGGLALLLYFFPALFLMRYASAIGRLRNSRSSEDLESALVNQKSFWKFVGILTIVVISFYVLMFVLSLILVGVGAAGAGGGGGNNPFGGAGGGTPPPTITIDDFQFDPN